MAEVYDGYVSYHVWEIIDTEWNVDGDVYGGMLMVAVCKCKICGKIAKRTVQAPQYGCTKRSLEEDNKNE
jgi:hypothetical protein